MPLNEIKYTKNDIIQAFKKIIKDNPANFDQTYLDELELEIIKIDNSSQNKVKLKIHNIVEVGILEKTIPLMKTPEDLVDILYSYILMESDLARKDPKTRKLIDKAGEEANKLVYRKRPFRYKILPWTYKGYYMGSVHVYWNEKQRILKKKYNIDWQTPQERCPDARFD